MCWKHFLVRGMLQVHDVMTFSKSHTAIGNREKGSFQVVSDYAIPHLFLKSKQETYVLTLLSLKKPNILTVPIQCSRSICPHAGLAYKRAEAKSGERDYPTS